MVPTEGVDSATDLSEEASGKTRLPLGVLLVVVLASSGTSGPWVGAAAGASVSGLGFLLGFIPAGTVKEVSRR